MWCWISQLVPLTSLKDVMSIQELNKPILKMEDEKWKGKTVTLKFGKSVLELWEFGGRSRQLVSL